MYTLEKNEGEGLFIYNGGILSVNDKIDCIVWSEVEYIESVSSAQSFFFFSSLTEFPKPSSETFFVKIPVFVNKFIYIGQKGSLSQWLAQLFRPSNQP